MGFTTSRLEDFLLEHHFAGVNDVKSGWFGLQRSYPLHAAAKEGELEGVLRRVRVGKAVSELTRYVRRSKEVG